MFTGAHVVIYSKDAEADKAFIRDVLEFSYVDAGTGRLIFKLPPAETQFHPSDENDKHELFLMCDDVAAVIAKLGDKGVACEPLVNAGWGQLTRISLPGGGSPRPLSTPPRTTVSHGFCDIRPDAPGTPQKSLQFPAQQRCAHRGVKTDFLLSYTVYSICG